MGISLQELKSIIDNVDNKKRKENGKKVGEKDSIYFSIAEKSLYSKIAIVLKTDTQKAREYVVNKIEKGK